MGKTYNIDRRFLKRRLNFILFDSKYLNFNSDNFDCIHPPAYDFWRSLFRISEYIEDEVSFG